MATNAISTAGHIESRGSRSLAPWLSRLVTIPPTIIMTLIGIRCISDPAHGVVATGMLLTTPEAATDARVVGALALTIAGFLASLLVSRNRLRAAHAAVITLMALILGVRLLGFAIDGTTLAMGGQKPKFIGELVFLTLNILAFSWQTYLSKHAGDQQ